ncbi:tRNA uridine-5-carboxymethylaminomethyl(34) synthesis GTPase MnmE [Silanimonas sp.]|uniref:tRNA uridine-5-carboxymethylaminomethyl(34) synthesis GTPase MnmE n=1 Tax=Silanimonas sp. TaxID=1929290 RepID=UPI0022BE447D|nr:tRNA uridine-5-carboxymethylaminomethyl(34) synthesis GTPase MnmE [Silanimonas sp.]MCZ8062186.1 tRNA uridine-5-carboxymethylaminomethyl(34) synthesis GTPase MnmE [Silanimonas sp.]
MSERDTIVAVATANGAAGIGVVRLSGPRAKPIAEALCATERPFVARQARYVRFHGADGEVIDDGLVIAFDAPRSFTGEDVVELQGHGNPRLLAQVVARCLALGARAARPGEFSERAFLEGKLDLAQAEAVADLITASSDAALRAARRSLDGVFSARVDELVEALTLLRVHVEAAIDFPEEEIDFLAAPELAARLARVEALHAALHRDAARGVRLVDGLHVVIVGAPNAGKSALMNALAGSERAIVTPIAGTTRDVLRDVIRIDGFELTLVDTAGLRETDDVVEAEGIRRARAEVAKADLVLAVLDDREADVAMARLRQERDVASRVFWVHTHADLTGTAGRVEQRDDGWHLWIDAPHGLGLGALRERLRDAAGVGEGSSGAFSARTRHVEAIVRAGTHLADAAAQLRARQGELAAEDLRLAQDALGEITGRISSDALLGRIFSSFCIGK